MDSSLPSFIIPPQNPNAEFHSITSQKLSKRQCALRRRSFKRQGKLLSKLERDFQSLLSFSPTTESNPKPRRDPDPRLQLQLRCWTESQEFLHNAIFDGKGGEGESFVFFTCLFEREESLREIYANDRGNCMLLCLVCGGEKKRTIYGSCSGLVQHACTVEKTKKVGAHRAFGRVVCEVRGWDVNEYSKICRLKAPRKLKKTKVSVVCYQSDVQYTDVTTVCYNPRSPYQVMPVNRSCSEMDLDKNDFQVAADNEDRSKGHDELVEKVQQLNFNATVSAAECNTLQSSTSLSGTNNCRKNFNSNANSSLHLMSTGRTCISSYFGLSGPNIEECIEKLKSLHGLCPGSELEEQGSIHGIGR